MTVEELALAVGGEILTAPENAGRTIGSAMTCDLLSWVMARGKADMAWVTVQTNINVVAVAALHDMACVVIPEGMRPDAPVTEKAAEEGVVLIRTDASAYSVCCTLHTGGVA
ncbi:MAG: AraC family transcriptional regulator [Eubacteriales bacterium]|nr:AraC family transcriptional regulator [Eubacteriales bacterium]